jgi:hypothetical protein
MRVPAFVLALIAAPMFAPLAAQAQAGMAACTAPTAPLPALYAPWATPAPLASAAAAADMPKAVIVPGRAVLASLHSTREVAYVIQPEKPGGSVSHGGLFEVDIDASGLYRFALGAGAWIDVLKDGKALDSVAHSPGPACTGIRKMVDFPLEPGRYVLQISANADPQLAILVLRQP